MPYTPETTRANLITAAAEEFAASGLAGARVDRIAAKAAANKQAIYFHFGSKEQLFDAVIEARCAHVLETVPFDPDDLPGFAAGILDYVAEHDDVVRLTTWQQLERPQRQEHGLVAYSPLITALSEHRSGGTQPTPERVAGAQDTLMLVLALCTAWTLATDALRLTPGLDPSVRQAIHREAVLEAVAALTSADVAAGAARA